MIKAIRLNNLLSFGAETKITLNPGLNVLIGANGSGKSNLIEAISLLQAMPKDLTKAIRDGGGIQEWLWKGECYPVAKIDAIIQNNKDQQPLRHRLEFQAVNFRIEIVSELIEDETIHNDMSYDTEQFHYKYTDQKATVNERIHDIERKSLDPSRSLNPKDYLRDYLYEVARIGSRRKLYWKNIESNQSILAQRQEPNAFPEMAYLGQSYQKIRIYREWLFGRSTTSRMPQKADLASDFLEENITNLALILNSLRQNREAKKKLLDALKLFYGDIEDFDVRIQGGYVEIFFQESNFNTPIPAARLSDGTLRFLSLLAILLHPNPPPLICIEEPELGLHPDVLPTLIDLLKEAAQKTQIIITTHSADLVDALSDMPEAVLVFDKQQGATTVTRLNKEDLIDWLRDYSLGQLWSRGHIGGNRW